MASVGTVPAAEAVGFEPTRNPGALRLKVLFSANQHHCFSSKATLRSHANERYSMRRAFRNVPWSRSLTRRIGIRSISIGFAASGTLRNSTGFGLPQRFPAFEIDASTSAFETGGSASARPERAKLNQLCNDQDEYEEGPRPREG
jgi:hypothetical protein